MLQMDASGNLPGADSLNNSFCVQPPQPPSDPTTATPTVTDYPSLDRYMRLRETGSASSAAITLDQNDKYGNKQQRQQCNEPPTTSPPSVVTSSSPSPRDSFNKRMMKVRLPSFLNKITSPSRRSLDLTDPVAAAGGGSFIDDSSTETSVMSENTLKTRYEAESPDELALVKAACSYGCRLVRRTPEHASVWLPSKYYKCSMPSNSGFNLFNDTTNL